VSNAVIPGRPEGEPGIRLAAFSTVKWIPGSMLRIAPE
jgi:hypothetical protein